MRTVYVVPYSYVDYCHAITNPQELAELAEALPCTKENAAKAFSNAGWEGDGELGVIWIPPFAFEGNDDYGLHIWHVKQCNNGTSWLCSSEPFKIQTRNCSLYEWEAVEVDEPAADTMLDMPHGVWG
jgi:hypothetical protein